MVTMFWRITDYRICDVASSVVDDASLALELLVVCVKYTWNSLGNHDRRSLLTDWSGHSTAARDCAPEKSDVSCSVRSTCRTMPNETKWVVLEHCMPLSGVITGLDNCISVHMSVTLLGIKRGFQWSICMSRSQVVQLKLTKVMCTSHDIQ